MEMNNFDYGDKQDNGQYENYPTITDGEYKNPVRSLYRHNRCKAITAISNEIAETYAKDPKYYSHTFCGQCRDHLPVSEFLWMDGGIVTSVVVGDIEVLAVNEDSPIVGYVMDPASSIIGDGDNVREKMLYTPIQEHSLKVPELKSSLHNQLHEKVMVAVSEFNKKISFERLRLEALYNPDDYDFWESPLTLRTDEDRKTFQFTKRIGATRKEPIVKILTTNRQYYVVSELLGKTLMVCTDCMIPSDMPGYVNNTEDCLHKTIE